LLHLAILPLPPRSPLFPYTTLFRSPRLPGLWDLPPQCSALQSEIAAGTVCLFPRCLPFPPGSTRRPKPLPEYTNRFAGLSVSKRSEEHTSELQSRFDLVCRLLLEKK